MCVVSGAGVDHGHYSLSVRLGTGETGFSTSSMRVVSAIAASETTGQCETSRARPWHAISSPDPGQDRARRLIKPSPTFGHSST